MIQLQLFRMSLLKIKTILALSSVVFLNSSFAQISNEEQEQVNSIQNDFFISYCELLGNRVAELGLMRSEGKSMANASRLAIEYYRTDKEKYFDFFFSDLICFETSSSILIL